MELELFYLRSYMQVCLHIVTRKRPWDGSHFSVANEEPEIPKKTQLARSDCNIDISVYV